MQCVNYSEDLLPLGQRKMLRNNTKSLGEIEILEVQERSRHI